MKETVIYHGQRQARGLGGLPMIYGLLIEQMESDYLITFMELENNEGTSVTNLSEQLATQVINEFGLEPGRCQFFEKYTYGTGNLDNCQPERIDRISYKWHWMQADNRTREGMPEGRFSGGWQATSPEWHYMIG